MDQVQDVLFSVPKHRFEDESDVFKGMFTIPQGQIMTEGQSKDKPLILEGVAAADFRSLLKVLCPR